MVRTTFEYRKDARDIYDSLYAFGSGGNHWPVTLNGYPAKITGWASEFALVSNTNGQSFNWSWNAVLRILQRDGNFFGD